ncbi:MAG: aminopeptidase, partial [Lachnospiraceae bacterium]|nr:aminopeptidase [Lachnospiraceae bacterium]
MFLLSEQELDEKFSAAPAGIRLYFSKVFSILRKSGTDKPISFSLENILEKRRGELAPGGYENSFACPGYAYQQLGECGKLFSFLYTEILSLPLSLFQEEAFLPDALSGVLSSLAELSLKLIGEKDYFARLRREAYPCLYAYALDTDEFRTRKRAEDQLIPGKYSLESFFKWEHLSDTDRRMIRFLEELPHQDKSAIAHTWVKGFTDGFKATRRDLSRKRSVQIRSPLCFAPVLGFAIKELQEIGLEAVLPPSPVSFLEGRGPQKRGVYGSFASRQYEYDHKDDLALFLDERFLEARLAHLKSAYQALSERAAALAGPMVLEAFGEEGFAYAPSPYAARYEEGQRSLFLKLQSSSAVISEEFIPSDEISYTIMALPVPEIGEEIFPKIFQDVQTINTLDSERFSKIQQKLIDVLDGAEFVRIKGRGDNRTDLKVNLRRLDAPERETKFENCVADVNIPVGEVFTSPVLEGTEGILHVSRVFLNGMEYKDLAVCIRDGMTAGFSLANFESEEANQKFFMENVLKFHESLPIGEFAIGTNTFAYAM